MITLIQACRFRTDEVANWEDGICKMNAGFGTADIDWIVDTNGKRVEGPVYDYKLVEGPLKYIELGR